MILKHSRFALESYTGNIKTIRGEIKHSWKGKLKNNNSRRDKTWIPRKHQTEIILNFWKTSISSFIDEML